MQQLCNPLIRCELRLIFSHLERFSSAGWYNLGWVCQNLFFLSQGAWSARSICFRLLYFNTLYRSDIFLRSFDTIYVLIFIFIKKVLIIVSVFRSVKDYLLDCEGLFRCWSLFRILLYLSLIWLTESEEREHEWTDWNEERLHCRCCGKRFHNDATQCKDELHELCIGLLNVELETAYLTLKKHSS